MNLGGLRALRRERSWTALSTARRCSGSPPVPARSTASVRCLPKLWLPAFKGSRGRARSFLTSRSDLSRPLLVEASSSALRLLGPSRSAHPRSGRCSREVLSFSTRERSPSCARRPSWPQGQTSVLPQPLREWARWALAFGESLVRMTGELPQARRSLRRDASCEGSRRFLLGRDRATWSAGSGRTGARVTSCCKGATPRRCVLLSLPRGTDRARACPLSSLTLTSGSLASCRVRPRSLWQRTSTQRTRCFPTGRRQGCRGTLASRGSCAWSSGEGARRERRRRLLRERSTRGRSCPRSLPFSLDASLTCGRTRRRGPT